jgi:hypothetical protein
VSGARPRRTVNVQVLEQRGIPQRAVKVDEITLT